MRRLMVLFLLAGPAFAAADDNLLKNGGVKGPKAWNHTHGAPTVTFKVDRKQGAKKKGALYIANTNASDKSPHNWRQTAKVPEGAPYRVKLSVTMRTQGMDIGSEACVMLQILPKQGEGSGRPIGYARCPDIRADTDWKTVHTVFEVPEECDSLFMMAYLVGKGEAWFDDFSITKTDEPLTEAPAGGDTRLWKLIRSCADEIDWMFDAKKAKARAKKKRKPLLVYVRCVDDQDNLASAQSDLRADKIQTRDDGLRKDVLFRAGPLSDPDIVDVIREHYVPLMLTYRLATHGQGNPNGDPLPAVGGRASEAVTPALLVVSAKGKLERKLHRIGTISPDLVDRWLRHGLKGRKADLKLLTKKSKPAPVRARAFMRLGKLDAAEEALAGNNSPEAALELGRLLLRRGEPAQAEVALARAGKSPEARFFHAWSLRLRGDQDKAHKIWQGLVGDTTYGRKAAACVMPQGPHLWLSVSERAWPASRALPEDTEGHGDAFDGPESVRLLLELQNGNGSFSNHRGSNGFGYIDGTITAFAAEALLRWQPHVPKTLAHKIDEALKRVLSYFDAWAATRGGSTVWNDPYVLMYLAQVRHSKPVKTLVKRIASTQLPDGNWTVYVADRPASFNTALNVMALVKAREVGWEVPEDVLARGAKALAAMRQDKDLFPYSTKTGHEWMTTEHASIARDALCEHTLLLVDDGSKAKLGKALERYMKFGHELRAPTKKLYDYFNSRGHGGYYYFFAHRNALEASAHVGSALRKKVADYVRKTVLAAREGDGAFMDHQMNGRAYGTAQALILLAPR